MMTNRSNDTICSEQSATHCGAKYSQKPTKCVFQQRASLFLELISILILIQFNNQQSYTGGCIRSFVMICLCSQVICLKPSMMSRYHTGVTNVLRSSVTSTRDIHQVNNIIQLWSLLALGPQRIHTKVIFKLNTWTQ